METTATLRGVRLSAQKGRLVADQIRGLPVDRALSLNPNLDLGWHVLGSWHQRLAELGSVKLGGAKAGYYTGWLNLIQVVPTLGKTPRFFTLSPDGHWLYALNEESDTVVQFTVEPATGRLSPIGQSVTCYSPVCLVFSRPRLGP